MHVEIQRKNPDGSPLTGFSTKLEGILTKYRELTFYRRMKAPGDVLPSTDCTSLFDELAMKAYKKEKGLRWDSVDTPQLSGKALNL